MKISAFIVGEVNAVSALAHHQSVPVVFNDCIMITNSIGAIAVDELVDSDFLWDLVAPLNGISPIPFSHSCFFNDESLGAYVLACVHYSKIRHMITHSFNYICWIYLAP